MSIVIFYDSMSFRQHILTQLVGPLQAKVGLHIGRIGICTMKTPERSRTSRVPLMYSPFDRMVNQMGNHSYDSVC